VRGYINFFDDPEAIRRGEKAKQVIVQVKSGYTGVTHVRDLKGVLAREKAAIGALITMREPTRPMLTEAAGAGGYVTKTALVVALLGISGMAPAKPLKDVTRAEARTLLLKALQAQGAPTKSRKFDLEDNTGNMKFFSSFYSFDAYLDEPGFLSIYGHYDVNRKTADVWDELGCHRLRPRAIKPLQKALRRKIGLSAEEYRRLSQEAPCSPN
jgi:NACHT-associated inactive Restriction Endonuclease 1